MTDGRPPHLDRRVAYRNDAEVRELERSLGLVSVVAISISAMLGSGIFVLPGLAALDAGPAIWLAYLVAAICVLPAAVSKAELSTAMPVAGGTYVYLDRVFGPLVGTVTGLALWASVLLKSAFALLGFGTYLVVIGDVPLKPTALVLLALIVVLNVVGMRAVSRAQIAVVVLTFAVLFGLLIAGLFTFDRANMSPALPRGARGLLAASGLVFVAYNGVTKIAAVAEEVRDPDKNMPLGMLVSLLLVAVIYTAVSFVLAGNVAPSVLRGDVHPIYSMALEIAGSPLGIAIVLVAVVSMTSMANAGLLAASRFPFAMSRDHLLPSALHGLSERFHTPVVAILVTGIAMGFAIVFLDLEALAKLASAIVISLHVAVNVAVIVFREVGVGWYRPKFRSPLYPWLQGFGVISGLGLLTTLGPQVLLAFGLVVIPGALVFLLYGRSRVVRRGILLQRGKRRDLLQRKEEEDFADRSSATDSALESGLIDVEDAITGKAAAVVAMFGDERGPETLVEIGTALAGGGRLPVMHVTEVPEQTFLGAMGEALQVRSLRRRLRVMAEEEGINVEFHAISSRDILHTVDSVTRRVRPDFLAMRWRRRATWALLPYNPLGWLIDHLDCNLALFRDAGVRYIREILVYAEPGPHDALVVGTADDLARLWGARVTLVRFIPGTATAEAAASERDYLSELQKFCEVPSRTQLLRGSDPVAEVTRASTGYDLLVMGSPSASFWQRLRGTPTERMIRHAACSVLTLKTPRERTHEAYARKREHRPAALNDYLVPEALSPQLEVTRKEALFEHFGGVFSSILGVESKAIVDALWERERTQNTSVGHGVALPHATLSSAKRTVVGLFTSSEPIDYHGPDGRKVDVFFVTVSPPSERQTHLELLSSIARLSMTTSLLDDVRLALTRDELKAAVSKTKG